jgi:hypothetical protein
MLERTVQWTNATKYIAKECRMLEAERKETFLCYKMSREFK